MTPKLLVTGELHPEALKQLKPFFETDYSPEIKRIDLIKKIKPFQCLIIRTSTQIDRGLLGHGSELKLVCRVGVGVDNIALSECTARGVRVANSPQGNRISAAEHTFALLLALAKDLPKHNQNLHEGGWGRKAEGWEISGKTLGIVGLGNIGRMVAARAQAFGMKVIATDPYVESAAAQALDVALLSLQDLLKAADFVSLHLPLTQETRGLASERFFSLMKPGSFFINTSRGAVVSEAALGAAFGKNITAAALDVFETEPLSPNSAFRKNPRIILTPHIAGQTQEAFLKMSLEAAQTVIDFFKTGNLANALN